MTDYAQVKIKDLKEAYEEGCDDVKRVLRKMYPETFEEKSTRTDITDEIEWKRHRAFGTFLYGYYEGVAIICASPTKGFVIRDYNPYVPVGKFEVEGGGDTHQVFKIKKGAL